MRKSVKAFNKSPVTPFCFNLKMRPYQKFWAYRERCLVNSKLSLNNWYFSCVMYKSWYTHKSLCLKPDIVSFLALALLSFSWTKTTFTFFYSSIKLTFFNLEIISKGFEMASPENGSLIIISWSWALFGSSFELTL